MGAHPDYNDVLQAGGAEALRRVLDAASTQPESPKQPVVLDTLEGLARLDLPKRDYVLSPVIPTRGLAMLFAARGVGKTHVGLGIGYAVATATAFLRWHAPKPRRVLYIDGEMPAEALQERGRALLAGSLARPPSPDFFTLLSMDRQDLGISLNLSKPEDQAVVEGALNGTEFLVLDNFSTLVHGGRENDAESWDAMQGWLLKFRRQGVSVLGVHHAGRGGSPRGTSKREDVLDTVIELRRPEDYDPEEGARFEVHLTKARGVFGDDALPFEARMQLQDGVAEWSVTILRDRVLDEIEELTRAGKSVRDIAEAAGLSKSKVNRLQARLREQGRL